MFLVHNIIADRFRPAEGRVDPANIRSIDPTCGKELEAGGRRIAELLNREQKIQPTTGVDKIMMRVQAILAARLSLNEIRQFRREIRELLQTYEARDDLQLLRRRNPKAESVIGGIADRCLTPDSQVHGMEHLTEFMGQKQRGKKGAVYYTHGCNADALQFINMIKREIVQNPNERQQEAAAGLYSSAVVVAGQQMLLEDFRGLTSDSVDTALMIPPKYLADDTYSDDERKLFGRFNNNYMKLLLHLLSSKDDVPIVAVEGGITPYREEDEATDVVKVLEPTAMKKVLFLPYEITYERQQLRDTLRNCVAPDTKATAASLYDVACQVTSMAIQQLYAMFYNKPPTISGREFLQFGLGGNMSFGPARANVYIGEPFALRSKDPDALVEKIRSHLQAVGAPWATVSGE